MSTWRVLATVEKVIDGDTFSATLDLGWGVMLHELKGAPRRVRILGYDSPERGEVGWSTATKILAAALPVGLEVWVTSHALDSFGRALCDVEMPDGSNLLDALPAEWHTDRFKALAAAQTIG